MIYALLWLAAALLACAAVHVVFVRPLYFRWLMRRQGVPGLPFVPLFGVFLERNRAHKADDPFGPMLRYTQRLGYTLTFNLGWIPRLFTAEPEVVHDVLVRQADAFVKSRITRSVLGPMLGRGLVTSEGELWRHQRKLINPAFHFSSLRAMVPLMDSRRALESVWRDGEEVEVGECMSTVTLAIIGAAAFGTDFVAEPEVARAVRDAFVDGLKTHIWRVFNLVGLIPLLRDVPTPGKRLVDDSRRRMSDIALGIIRARREGRTRNMLDNESGKDLLDLLLEARGDGGDGDGGMPLDLLLDELRSFILAGHETTSNLLTWVLLELMRHPEMWDRLAAEVDARLPGGRAPSYDDLREMEYLNAVVNEGLRHHPPVSVVAREAVRDVDLHRGDGSVVRLPAGYTVVCSINRIHHRADIYERADEFVPDRWLGDAEKVRQRRQPCSFIPFVAGRRSCIGSNFARLEACHVLCRVVQRYRLEMVPGQRIVPQPNITVSLKYGLRAVVRERALR